MKKERKLLRVADLQLNEGQLGWLPKNPRQWTQEDIDKTAASIDEDEDFLEERPILVIPIPGTGDFVVFCGNLRREGAKAAGLVKVPCVVHYPETEEDREAVLRRSLKDNGSFGHFDWDEMANSPVWGQFDLASFGIPSWPHPEGGEGGQQGAGGTGGGEAHEDDFDEESDEIHVRCKKGDIWQLGDHRLMCGDSTDLDTVKKLMGGGTTDIAFFSPPYNTGGLGKNIKKDNGRSKYINYDDNMSDQDYTKFLNKSIACASAFSQFRFLNIQFLANNKRSIVNMLNDNLSTLADIIVWDKTRSQPQLAASVLNSEYEFVFCFSDKGNRAIGTIPFHGTEKNIVHISPGHNEFAKIHNAVFPVELAGHFIGKFAKESVLDLFGGCGTTMIAAEQLGRKCYMMELDPHYCDVILARWEKLTGKEAVKLN